MKVDWVKVEGEGQNVVMYVEGRVVLGNEEAFPNEKFR